MCLGGWIRFCKSASLAKSTSTFLCLSKLQKIKMYNCKRNPENPLMFHILTMFYLNSANAPFKNWSSILWGGLHTLISVVLFTDIWQSLSQIYRDYSFWLLWRFHKLSVSSPEMDISLLMFFTHLCQYKGTSGWV